MRFSGFGGTESYMLTVARQLQQLGHDAIIHAADVGPMAELAERHGIPVVHGARGAPASCDAVLAQDAHAAYALGARYPSAVCLYTMHSSHHPVQSLPPQTAGGGAAIVVMNDRVRRRVEALGWHPPIVRLRQPIDLARFGTRLPVAETRRHPRVLELGNYVTGPRARMIERACADAGVELRRVGAQTQPSPTPEAEIAQAEIVIALGRGVLEAMGAGRAGYVLGPGGGDGWVTAGSYEQLERDGFSGRATDAVIDADRLALDLSGWTEDRGEVGRELVWAHHDAERHAVELVEVVRGLDAGAIRPSTDGEELARRTRLEWDSFASAAGALAEVRQLRVQCEELRDEARAAHEWVRDVNATLAACQARVEELERSPNGLRPADPVDALRSPALREVLARIWAAGVENDPHARLEFCRQRAARGARLPTIEAAGIYRNAALAVAADVGTLLYVIALALRPRRIVEFGTSFGASTIHLAAALRDGGGDGRLISSEIDPLKAEVASRNLADAGVGDLVEIRVGDARETLGACGGPVDLLFLDGFGESRLDVLHVMEPGLAPGALVVADQSADDPDWPDYHRYVNDPDGGYTSVGLPLGAGVELSARRPAISAA